MSGTPKLSVTIPCYNEETTLPETIPPLLDKLDMLDVHYELVLVDNGSVDATPDIIDGFIAAGRPVRRANVPINKGYGLGIITGVKASIGEHICVMWADGQVSPEDVAAVCRQSLLEQKNVMVKVRRITRGDGPLRKFISSVYNMLFKILFGRITPDVNGCPKVAHRDYWWLIDPGIKTSFIDAEIMIKASRLGMNIVEVPVKFLPRRHGGSKVRLIGYIVIFLGDLITYRFGRALPTWERQIKKAAANEFVKE